MDSQGDTGTESEVYLYPSEQYRSQPKNTAPQSTLERGS